MIPVKASSFGRRTGCARRYPGGRRYRSILRTVSRASPKRARGRALAQSLHIDAAPHRRIELHSIHPSCVPQHTLGMLGGPPTRSGFPPPAGRVSPRRAVVYSCSAVLRDCRFWRGSRTQELRERPPVDCQAAMTCDRHVLLTSGGKWHPDEGHGDNHDQRRHATSDTMGIHSTFQSPLT